MPREVPFGGRTLVQGRDFERKRGSVLIVEWRTGSMACLECGHCWRVPLSGGFYPTNASTCPRCGAGTKRRKVEPGGVDSDADVP